MKLVNTTNPTTEVLVRRCEQNHESSGIHPTISIIKLRKFKVTLSMLNSEVPGFHVTKATVYAEVSGPDDF